MMNEENTPAIASILKQHQLLAIPEAHTYLKYENIRFDITFPEKVKYPSLNQFQQETEISPEQIGVFKVEWHKKYLRRWQQRHTPNLAFNQLWEIRESCIKQLSQ